MAQILIYLAYLHYNHICMELTPEEMPALLKFALIYNVCQHFHFYPCIVNGPWLQTQHLIPESTDS